MIWPNQPLHCDAYIRFGSAGEPLRWYISQPAKCGPLTSHFSRLPSAVRTNAPLCVPTSTRTLLILHSSLNSFTAISSFQTFNVNLGHLQHGFENSLRLHRIFVAHQFHQCLGNNLPRYAEFVLQPPALHVFSARRELFPKLVHFCLGLAVHKERYGGRENVMRAAVQRCELLPLQLESHRHCGSFRPRAGFSVASDIQNFRILENGSIEVCCLFRIAVKPQEWSYFLHVSPFTNQRLCRRGRRNKHPWRDIRACAGKNIGAGSIAIYSCTWTLGCLRKLRAHLFHKLAHGSDTSWIAAFAPGFEALRCFFQVCEELLIHELLPSLRDHRFDALPDPEKLAAGLKEKVF